MDHLLHGVNLWIICLAVLWFQERVLALYGNQCAKNPNVDKDAPNNIYFCPFENPDGTLNEYTECCYNDRADEEGNYYSCCKSDSDRESERTAKSQRIGFMIGGVAAVLFTVVFLLTYCRSDTFAFVERVKGRLTYWWQWMSDHVCFCLCCNKTYQREEKKENLEIEMEDKTVFEIW